MTQRRHAPGVVIAAVLTAVLPATAAALPDDRKAPIVIRTREAIRDEVTGTTTYRGEVQLRQGSLRIDADEIVVESTGREPTRVTALGRPAHVEELPAVDALPLRAAARRILYLRARGLLRLRGDARVTQGDTSLHSAQVDVDMGAHRIRASSDPARGQRVRSVIAPELLGGEAVPGGSPAPSR